MRRDFFGCCDLPGIFFDHILNCLHTNSFSLGRIEESVLMTGQRSDSFTNLQIFSESFFYLRTKIDNHFISTFSGDFDSVIFKIYIFNIQPDTFRNTDSRSKKESNDRKITFFCFFIEYTFLSGKSISAMFNIIQKHGNLICIQTDDTFFMDLGNIDQNGGIGLDHFTLIIISIKTSQSRNLSFQTTFSICFSFVTGLI